MFTFGLLLVAAIVQPPTTGKGFGKPQAATKPKDIRNRPAVADFEAWAKESKIEKPIPLKIVDFGDERGVSAPEGAESGARVLAVPSRLALQVTSLSGKPRWCKDEEAWRTAKWDARLAMMLLHEESDKRSDVKPWLAQLPREFDTPVLWPKPSAIFDAVGYPALGKAVSRQRAEWDATRQRAPGPPSAEAWDWAMNVVRSRAFSGPYAPGTFVGSLTQLFAASTLALGYAVTNGGAGAADAALNFFLLAVVFVLFNDFVFGPRLANAKRYVVCPWIDMINHDGALTQSDVAYEYFSDKFAVRLDPSSGPVPSGGQVLISYGERSNDVLLQYYGFVQRDNPHDQYVMEQEDFILAVDGLTSLPADALGALQECGLTDPNALLALRVDGAADETTRLMRLLLYPAAAKAADSGRAALDGASETTVREMLAVLAKSRADALAVPDRLPDQVPRSLVEAFVAEKRRVLKASMLALA